MECTHDLSTIEPNDAGLVVCPDCNLHYAIELIDGADPDKWEHVRTEGKFRRFGNALWFGEEVLAQ